MAQAKHTTAEESYSVTAARCTAAMQTLRDAVEAQTNHYVMVAVNNAHDPETCVDFVAHMDSMVRRKKQFDEMLCCLRSVEEFLTTRT
jgi:hypothetical protein